LVISGSPLTTEYHNFSIVGCGITFLMFSLETFILKRRKLLVVSEYMGFGDFNALFYIFLISSK